MGNLRRNERRAMLDRCVDVYSADTSRGWRVVKKVTALYAFNKVQERKWEEIFDDMGNFYGVKMLAAAKSEEELPSGTSATTITARDAMVYAGLSGASRTIGRSEEYRITRYDRATCRPLPPEDQVERVLAKVRQWPYPASRIDDGRGRAIYGDRAIRCYPRS